MASSRSSSLSRSEISWATRSSFAARSQRHSFPTVYGNSDFSPAPRQAAGHVEDLLGPLKEHGGDLRKDTSTHAARLEREFHQLRSATHRGEDPLAQTSPAGMSRAGTEISVQDLVERELKAHGRTVDRSPTDDLVMDRRTSVPSSPVDRLACFDTFSDGGDSERRRAADLGNRPALSYLYKEMENKDAALRQARQEIRRLQDENEACQEAHTRDITTLEGMLRSVMDESDKLKEALNVALGLKVPKYSQQAIAEDIERSVISNFLIQSGIPHMSATPNSNGSASTQTPPDRSDASSLDVSRASLQLNLM